jgi:hypothetical protein
MHEEFYTDVQNLVFTSGHRHQAKLKVLSAPMSLGIDDVTSLISLSGM